MSNFKPQIMNKLQTVIAVLLIHTSVFSQDKSLPYYEIPSQPETFTAGGVASRMIDGLGFRFYWATEELRPEDLAWKPGNDTRTTEETITHVYEMTALILNSTTNTPNVRSDPKPKLSFAEMRRGALENLKKASENLRTKSDAEMNGLKIIFKRDNNVQEFPFWNQINGPIADCLWHVGQIVSFRRSSGNPFTDKASVFTGTVRK
jgi:hypothetical protein